MSHPARSDGHNRLPGVVLAVLTLLPAAVPAGGEDAWAPSPTALARAARTPSRYDPAGNACTGGLTPGAASLRALLARLFRVEDIGGYACRPNTANRSRLSVHAVGRALDVMVGSSRGDMIADWLLANADALDVQLLIWRRRIWRSGQADVRVYTGPNPHTDHIHVEVLEGAVPNAGLAIRVHLEPARWG